MCKMTFYDKCLCQHTVEIKRGYNGIYYVYIDYSFYCSAESVREAEDELEDYIKTSAWKPLFELV